MKQWESQNKLTVSQKLRIGKNAELVQVNADNSETPLHYSEMTAGTGFTGTGTVYKTSVTEAGGIITTRILLDITGLSSSAAGDIIGGEALANCHFGQITAAVNGTIIGGTMTCLETPATGEPDIDIYAATEATGTEDAAISGLVETAIQAVAQDWAVSADLSFGTIAANKYLYLVGSGAGTDAVYTAGQFLIEIYGYRA